MSKTTEDFLRSDPIAEVESMLGNKSCKDFNSGELAFLLSYSGTSNNMKNEHFKSIEDTYSRMTWSEFKNLIKSNGFIPAMEYDFKDDKSDQVNEFILYYNKEKGLIICATSYSNKTSVNGGNLYGEIQANDKESGYIIFQWLSTGGMVDKEKLIFSTSHDVREGLFSKLKILESAGTFIPKWVEKNRFLWFLDYNEKNKKDYDYEKISQSKIDKCPDDFKAIIGR